MVAIDTNILRGIADGIGLVLFYGSAFWLIFKRNSANKVIQCGSVTLIVFVVMLALFKSLSPAWVLRWILLLVLLLGFLTMFFLVQQGYRAVRRRKTSLEPRIDQSSSD